MGISRAKRRKKGRGHSGVNIHQDFSGHLPKTETFVVLLEQALRERQSDHPEGFLARAEQLWNRFPNRPESFAILAAAALTNGYLALSVHTLRAFLERWPNHEDAPPSRKTLAELEEALDLLGHSTPVELGAQHDWMQWYLNSGRPAQARDLARRVLKSTPKDWTSLHHLSKAQYAMGQRQEALTTAQSALQLEPDNIDALARLVEWKVLSGETAEAEELARKLKACQPDNPHHCCLVGRALSFLGDDQGVIVALSHATELDPFPIPVRLEHYAAVAWARQGNWKRAKELWKKAAEKGLEIAGENLDNAQMPVSQRHSPWAFELEEWVDFARLEGCKSQRDRSRKFPELEALIPLLLDRGCPIATRSCLRLLKGSPNPNLLESLRQFALSKHGSDDLRLKAAQVCRGAGILPHEGVRLWQSGQWKEVALIGFRLHWDPGKKLPHKAARLEDQAVMALGRQKYVEAEALLKKALLLAPESPALRNNLAVAYYFTGRQEQALELWRQLQTSDHDYPFAPITLASLSILEGKLDEARHLLQPVLAQNQLHYSEFASLCNVQMQLAEVENSRSERNIWKELWLEAESQDSEAARYRPARIDEADGLAGAVWR